MENQHNKDCEKALLALRQDIDKIDDQILSLLMARMKIVTQVGELKESNSEKFFIRSNREADMIRDLIKKSQNKLPKITIFNIWRKIITTANMAEQPIHMAIYNPQKIANYGFLVKDYYNVTVPISNFDQADDVLKLVQNDNSKIGFFALPKDEGLNDNWWTILAKNYPDLKIFAKIPFFQFEQEKEQIELVAIALKKCEKSSDDNSLLYVNLSSGQSQDQIMAKLKENNISAKTLNVIDDDILLELEGFFDEDDDRLSDLNNFKILGHYPLPIIL